MPQVAGVVIVVIVAEKQKYDLWTVKVTLLSDQQILLIGAVSTNTQVVNGPIGQLRAQLLGESLRPLDVDTIISSVKKTNRFVSVEEGWPVTGVGAEMAALAMEHAFDYLDAPVTRVCGADVPMPYAANLEKLALPQPDWVVQAVKAVCYR